MTTFTKLSDVDVPSISVYPSRKLSKVNDNVCTCTSRLV
jgi:hypothetical protein